MFSLGILIGTLITAGIAYISIDNLEIENNTLKRQLKVKQWLDERREDE